MKFIKKTCQVSPLLLLISAYSYSADTAKIQFKATFVAASCNISVFNDKKVKGDVDFGKVITTNIIYERVSPKEITLQLSNCQNIDLVTPSINLSGTTLSGDNTLFNNLVDQNIGVALLKDNGERFKPGDIVWTGKDDGTTDYSEKTFESNIFCINCQKSADIKATELNATMTFQVEYR